MEHTMKSYGKMNSMKRTLKFYSNANLMDPERRLMPIRQMAISNFTEAVTISECDMDEDTGDYNHFFKSTTYMKMVTKRNLHSCVWNLCLQLHYKANNSASRIITLSKVNKYYARRKTLKCPYFGKRNNEHMYNIYYEGLR